MAAAHQSVHWENNQSNRNHPHQICISWSVLLKPPPSLWYNMPYCPCRDMYLGLIRCQPIVAILANETFCITPYIAHIAQPVMIRTPEAIAQSLRSFCNCWVHSWAFYIVCQRAKAQTRRGEYMSAMGLLISSVLAWVQAAHILTGGMGVCSFPWCSWQSPSDKQAWILSVQTSPAGFGMSNR